MNKLWPAKVSGWFEHIKLQHWGNFDEDILFERKEWKARFWKNELDESVVISWKDSGITKPAEFGEFPQKLAKNTQQSDALATSTTISPHKLD